MARRTLSRNTSNVLMPEAEDIRGSIITQTSNPPGSATDHAGAKKTLAAAVIQEIKPVGTPGAEVSINTHAAIAQRAYELYCERCANGLPGSPESDWHQAERDVWAHIAGR